MNSIKLKEKIKNLSIWKKGDQRAPHKPLLLLYALGQIQNNNVRYLSYKDIRENLKSLLIEFGPKRKSYHPEHPFVRLVNDGIWQLNKTIEDMDKANDNWLINNQVIGGFNEEAYSLLVKSSNLVQEIAETLLHLHFPESMHEDILSAVGLDFNPLGNKRRDPYFREKILNAYEYKCAVCGFDVRLGNTLVAVEAAHIKWHQAGGPDIEENGIALCSMHHKLFDRGVFSLSQNREVLVSEEAHGTNGFEEWLLRYHGKKINMPIRPDYLPRENFVNWHLREVFKGRERYIVNSNYY
ncbi:MAG: phosphorothioated DNA-binding restriction endonuclease [Peptococcales bacterium]|jgi:putative restriction endonuclease